MRTASRQTLLHRTFNIRRMLALSRSRNCSSNGGISFMSAIQVERLAFNLECLISFAPIPFTTTPRLRIGRVSRRETKRDILYSWEFLQLHSLTEIKKALNVRREMMRKIQRCFKNYNCHSSVKIAAQSSFVSCYVYIWLLSRTFLFYLSSPFFASLLLSHVPVH